MFTPEMSYNEMVARFNELVATSYEYLKAIYFKKEEETKEAVRAYKTAMSNLGYTEEQMKDCLSTEDLPEGFHHQGILALPETTQKAEEEVSTVAEPASINPVSVEQEEETIPSLEDLLSDDPLEDAGLRVDIEAGPGKAFASLPMAIADYLDKNN